MDIDDTSGSTSAVNLDLILSTEYTNMYMRIADAACVQVITLSIHSSALLTTHFYSSLYPLISPSAPLLNHPFIYSFTYLC